jgi:methionyl-tRNA formyltransferase
MNIVFFTQEDPFYVKSFFDEFFENSKTLDEIKAIVISQPMGKKSALSLARQMYEFYGLLDFVRMGLIYSYVKLMGKRRIQPPDTQPIPKTYTIKQLARAYGLGVIEQSDLNSRVFQQVIRQYDPDLFISVASPVIFKEDLIEIPKLECINIHNAPLPRYRGMFPSFWQLYHGETEAGITIHRINSGIDTGDIITQHYLTIEPDETLNDLIVKTKREGAKLMIETIEAFRKGRVQYKKMKGEGSYFSFPTRKDVREFKRRGKKII